MSAVPANITDRSSRPPLLRLAIVEARKMVDTRAGLWLLILAGLVAIGGALAQSLGSDEAQGGDVFFTAAGAVSVLLPIVGILLVTSEWSQRTGLVTFALVPRRERIVAAKLMAAVAVAVLVATICLLLGLLGGSLFGSGSEISSSEIGRGYLFLTTAVLIGVGLGLAFENSPMAIVFNFAGPIVISAIGVISSGINDVTVWLDQSVLITLVDNPGPSDDDWQKFAVTVLVWFVLPLVAGMLRLRRGDID